MEKKFCPYCGSPLTNGCSCQEDAEYEARQDAILAAEDAERWLEDYYDDPLVNAGWAQSDLIDMYRRER